jgi:hypothetical protein
VEIVQKYLFWIVTGAIVAVAVALYAAVVPAKWLANDELLQECKGMDARITSEAASADALPNQRYCDEAVRRKKTLNDQMEKVRKVWENRAVDTREYDEGADRAPDDPFPFVDWYEKRKKAILDEASKQGLLFPRQKDSGSGRGDYGDDGFLRSDAKLARSAIPQAKKRLLVTQEIYRTLGSVKVQAWDPKMPSTEDERLPNAPEMADQDKKVGVVELLSLKFVPEKEYEARRKAAWTEALRLAKTNKQPPEDEIANPYTSFGVELSVLAHVSSITRLIQQIESNEKFLAVIKRLDVQRADPEFVPFGERLGVDPKTGKPAADSTSARHWYNDRYEEPPMFAFIEIEIMEFPADITKVGDFTPRVERRAPARPAAGKPAKGGVVRKK